MKHPCETQILCGIDQLGWTPEQASQQLDIPLSEVRSVLARVKGLTAAVEDLDSPEEILAAIKSISIAADSDKIKLDALKYLHAEKTGRNNIESERLHLQKQKLQLDAINVIDKVGGFNKAQERARKAIASVTMPRALLPQES